MEYWIIILIIILFIIVGFILVYKGYFKIPFKPFSKQGAAEKEDSSEKICKKVEKYARYFVNNDLNTKRISKVDILVSDITQDFGDIAKVNNLETINIKSAKLILDTILHSYIYEKSPNKISREALTDNVKKLKTVIEKNSCFNNDRVEQIISRVKDIIEKGKDEEINEKDKDKDKIKKMTPRDYIRKIKLLELSIEKVHEINKLKDELSKKNVELRECKDALDKSRYNVRDDLALEICERQRRTLQEKVYELRRDIERYQLSPNLTSNELNQLRTRLEDCQRQNAVLDSDLKKARQEHDARETEIRQLSKDLQDCHMIVSALSNA